MDCRRNSNRDTLLNPTKTGKGEVMCIVYKIKQTDKSHITMHFTFYNEIILAMMYICLFRFGNFPVHGIDFIPSALSTIRTE